MRMYLYTLERKGSIALKIIYYYDEQTTRNLNDVNCIQNCQKVRVLKQKKVDDYNFRILTRLPLSLLLLRAVKQTFRILHKPRFYSFPSLEKLLPFYEHVFPSPKFISDCSDLARLTISLSVNLLDVSYFFDVDEKEVFLAPILGFLSVSKVPFEAFMVFR